MTSGWNCKTAGFFCWSANARKRVIRKLKQSLIYEEVAFLFAFQMEPFARPELSTSRKASFTFPLLAGFDFQVASPSL
jgi:hypothetical protein